MRRSVLLPVLFLAALPLTAGATPPSFIEFETDPVRPLALSPDGKRLFAVNIPDGSLSIFDVSPSGLSLAGSVLVGLEPVAVAARTNDEVWVVNELSDSISVVDVPTLRVTRTLLVGDEPRDIVFAGAGKARAFITTAHRGQQRTDPSLASVPGAGDPLFSTPGVGRADVWVFDAASPGDGPGGIPLAIVTLFGDTPRALATTPDGATVYAAVFHSGNETTIVPAGAVCPGFDKGAPCTVDGAQLPGGSPGPATNHAGDPAPHVGLIVQRDDASGKWVDELARDWSGAVRFNLPDLDVFTIDASTLKPGPSFAHVGTTLFNMAVNPKDGTVYVSSQEANNAQRFEGPGTFAGHTVRGHLAESRIALLQGDGSVLSRHLNKHIDYALDPVPPGTGEHSLATPVDMAVSSDGSTLYVAAFGSSKVGVLSTAALADDSFDPASDSKHYLDVSGGGPAGLALDEAHNRLYVLTRFDDAVSVIELASGQESAHLPLPNPEPAPVVAGRRFLYDATMSPNGETSCSSCHVFGDLDSLAWDLGNPDADVTRSPIEILLGSAAGLFPQINGSGKAEDFHPMKGPMTTQTLRGMVNSGAEHWRGDRSVGHYGTSATDARLSFRNFIVAFDGLLGRTEPVSDADMDSFADFAMALTMPPNPVRNLDDSLSPSAQRGRDFYLGPRLADGVPGFGFACEGCHSLDPSKGFFGTGTKQSFENETQIIKVPQLRNAYQKVGMFGMMKVPFFLPTDSSSQGDQIRGFGFLHDGSTDTLFRFFHATVFQATSSAGFDGGDEQRRDVEQFVLSFDSDLAPVVGQQATLRADNLSTIGPRIDLLIQRARTPFVSRILGDGATECDLVARVRVGDHVRGYLMGRDGTFSANDGTPARSDAELRALAATEGQEITYTAMPPGSGARAVAVAVPAESTPPHNPDNKACSCSTTTPADATMSGLILLVLLRWRRTPLSMG